MDSATPLCVSIQKSDLIKRGYASFSQWKDHPHHLYIGRCMKFVEGASASKWQNIYSSQQFGLAKCLKLFEDRVRNTPELMESIPELEGMELGCWCKPNHCHGDILIKLYCEYSQMKNNTKEVWEELFAAEIDMLIPLKRDTIV